jgi:hypothetical protein
VTDGKIGAEPGEMGAELGEAANVAGGEQLGPRGQDGFRLFLSQRGRDFRLVHVVGARAAAPGIARNRSRGSRRTFWAFARWQASW